MKKLVRIIALCFSIFYGSSLVDINNNAIAHTIITKAIAKRPDFGKYLIGAHIV